MTTRDEAIQAALFAHDGMERLIREDGLPREAVEREPVGFLVALEALGYTVVPASPRDIELGAIAAKWHRRAIDAELSLAECQELP